MKDVKTRFYILKERILKLSDILETAIALFLVVISIALTIKFIYSVAMEGPVNWDQETIHTVLQNAFNLIIAVEFIRMLLKHSVGSILEIVLFSVARGMVVGHAGALETVLIVLAIGLVLFIRKFLLLPHDLDESMEEVGEDFGQEQDVDEAKTKELGDLDE